MTTLAKLLEEKLKIVRVSIADVLKSVLARPEGKLAAEAKEELINGRIPRDEVCLELLNRRLQELDC